MSTKKRANNRLDLIEDAAAKLFASKGYKATTMRDIASEAGMLPGSLYYHFPSKQDLLVVIYTKAVDSLLAQVSAAAEPIDDPWDALEAAIKAHVAAILDDNDYARVILGVTPQDAPDVETALTALRDRYEKLFASLLRPLSVRPGMQKKLLRILIIGTMNSTQIWYRPGRLSPQQIGTAIYQMIRLPLEQAIEQ